MSKTDKPRVLKVWCGRRDEAHRQQKQEVRTPLTYIEPVKTGTPTKTFIPNNVAVPSVCKKVTDVYFPGRRRSKSTAAYFDWEKSRHLWRRAYIVNKELKSMKKVEAMLDRQEIKDEDITSEFKKNFLVKQDVAVRRHLDAFSVEPFPGHLQVTCPVCGTIYRLTLYGEVAEWLDQQLGKSRYVSAKHLEKLSLEMMRKQSH